MSSGVAYWCYTCSLPVELVDDAICPYCDGGFVQQLNEIQVIGSHQYGFSPQYGSSPQLDVIGSPQYELEVIGSPQYEVEVIGSPQYGSSSQLEESYQMSESESVVVQLVEQLSMNDNNQCGPPPAPRSSINAIPTIKISNAHLRSDSHCSICQERFVLRSEAKQMPCNHIFHFDCILPWLVQHNSCPVCRVALPPPESDSSLGSRSRGRRTGRENSSHNRRQRNPLSFLWPFGSSSSNTNNHRH